MTIYNYCTKCGERLSEEEAEFAQAVDDVPICLSCTEDMAGSSDDVFADLVPVIEGSFEPLLEALGGEGGSDDE